MKILYLSCHSVLEYDELCLLTELESRTNPGFNVDVFSMGAYMNPTQSGDYMRSVIPNGKHHPDLYGIAMQCDKDNLHPELIEWADVILSMHNSRIPGQTAEQPWIVNNWEKIKHKKVVWRSIGQSTPAIEKELKKYKAEGLKIVRYSPMEQSIPDYAGHDDIIRFYKDPDEFHNWNGNKLQVITFAQSFKKRGAHLGFSVFDRVTAGLTAKAFGTENDDLGFINGGHRSYNELKQEMQDNRVFWYFGTQPAPYTLSFIEAMMTGTPIVAVGTGMRENDAYKWKNYEIPDIIQNGVNGYIANSSDEMRGYIQVLLEDFATAQRISEAGRKTAIQLFGKQTIMQQWSDFLKNLMQP
jgi:glycosyltransferase involved in cell wall biosynthesis